LGALLAPGGRTLLRRTLLRLVLEAPIVREVFIVAVAATSGSCGDALSARALGPGAGVEEVGVGDRGDPSTEGGRNSGDPATGSTGEERLPEREEGLEGVEGPRDRSASTYRSSAFTKWSTTGEE
jgi:hypothetical protein